MAVDERTRRMLHDRPEEVLDVGHGDVLLDHLPPTGWSELATRRDIDELADTNRHELAALEQRLTHRLDRTDDRLVHFEQRIEDRFTRVEDRFTRVDEQFAQLEERFVGQTAEIAAFRGEIITAMTVQFRQTVFAVIGMLLAVAALVAAVLGLG